MNDTELEPNGFLVISTKGQSGESVIKIPARINTWPKEEKT